MHVCNLHLCWCSMFVMSYPPHLLQSPSCLCLCSVSLTEPGGSCRCELIVRTSDVQGSFSLSILCEIEHTSTPLLLPVCGYTQVHALVSSCCVLSHLLFLSLLSCGFSLSLMPFHIFPNSHFLSCMFFSGSHCNHGCVVS